MLVELTKIAITSGFSRSQQVNVCTFPLIFWSVTSERCAQVETAYDILLMQSMKKRLSGEGVAQSVRFADVARQKTVKQVCLLACPSGTIYPKLMLERVALD